jgi:hypothetical protein
LLTEYDLTSRHRISQLKYMTTKDNIVRIMPLCVWEVMEIRRIAENGLLQFLSNLFYDPATMVARFAAAFFLPLTCLSLQHSWIILTSNSSVHTCKHTYLTRTSYYLFVDRDV